MSQAATLSARALQQRLNRVGWMLFARQFVRALPHALIAASAGVVTATVLLVLLPAALFGAAIVSVQAVLPVFGGAGAVLGFALRLRHARKPAAHETVLALESRIGTPTASLATALEACGEFAAPVLQRAAGELEAALAARGPQLFSNRALLAAPAAILLAALTTALAWSTGAEAPQPGRPAALPAGGGGLSALDAGTGRDGDDARARAEAMGLRKAAAALQTAATVLRQPGASESAIGETLTAAKKGVGELPAGLQPAIDIPGVPGGSAEDRASLATTLESAAGGLSAAADKAAAAGSAGSGTGIDTPATGRSFVLFPVQGGVSHSAATSDYVVGQSPARRALVRRAMDAAKQE